MCGHPEPSPQGSPDAWAEWDDDHPVGHDACGDMADRICLLTETGRYCKGCTEWMGQHIDLDGDYVSAGECIVRSSPAFRVLTGEA